MSQFKRLTGLIIIVLLASCSTSDRTPQVELIKLRLNWTHEAAFLGFYVADTLGYYAEEGLEVEMVPTNDPSNLPFITGEVAEGVYDFAVGGGGLVANGQGEGEAVTVIATIYQLSPNAFFARADSGIEALDDLQGKRIGIVSENGQRNLEALLETANLTVDDVDLVSVGYDLTPFIEGDVDVWNGFLTNEAIKARLQGIELVTFPLYEYGIENTTTVLITSQQLLEQDEQTAVRFLRATLRGWQWTVKNPADAIDLMLERFPEFKDNRDFHAASLDAYIPLLRPRGTQIGAIDCEQWLSDPRLENLEVSDRLCTTEIFEQARLEQ